MNTDTERETYLISLDAFLKILEADDASVTTDLLKKEVVENLAFLTAFLMDPPLLFVVDGTLKKLESLAEKLHRVAVSGEKELDIEVLQQRLRPVRDWRRTAQKIHRRRLEKLSPSRKYYPMICDVGFVGYLENHLEEVVKSKADSIGPLKCFISRLSQKLRFRNSRLMGTPDPELTKDTTNLAYETEFAIDSYLVGNTPMWFCMSWLCDLTQDLEHQPVPVLNRVDINSMAEALISRIKIAREKEGPHIIPILLRNSFRVAYDSGISRDDAVELLTQVYRHSPMVSMFEIRTSTWASSHDRKRREVLLDLLQHLSTEPKVDWPDQRQLKYQSELQLITLVSKLFEGKNCLIFLDYVDWYDIIWELRRILRGTRSLILFTTASREIYDSYAYDEDQTSVSETNTSTSSSNPTTADDVVGFGVETKETIERLIGEPKQLRIISIFGVAGQGKTTLAKKVYGHPSVANYFHVRLWCSVSQVYEKRDLLLQLLGQVVKLSDGASQQKNDAEPAEMLYRSLKKRRFLIVLDDLWTVDAWNDLTRCFPDDENGSRIIFTTRQKGLASQAQSSSMLQPLSPLSAEDCWKLLRKRFPQVESYDSELLQVGRRITEKCKGLPLSIILVAGILSKMEKIVDQWKNIEKNLSQRLLENEDSQGKGVIELSYMHLPNHLKSCFLYLGAFLEDKEIPVSKLIRLWIGEGFIEYSNSKNLEDVAEGYLKDLIDRSLVTVTQKKLNGQVKSCHVHDLLHSFCMARSREENFWQLVQGYATHFLLRII